MQVLHSSIANSGISDDVKFPDYGGNLGQNRVQLRQSLALSRPMLAARTRYFDQDSFEIIVIQILEWNAENTSRVSHRVYLANAADERYDMDNTTAVTPEFREDRQRYYTVQIFTIMAWSIDLFSPLWASLYYSMLASVVIISVGRREVCSRSVSWNRS
jgi:hypothetical protein